MDSHILFLTSKMKFSSFVFVISHFFAQFIIENVCFSTFSTNRFPLSRQLSMAVKNDPFARANREMRKAGADDRFIFPILHVLPY